MLLLLQNQQVPLFYLTSLMTQPWPPELIDEENLILVAIIHDDNINEVWTYTQNCYQEMCTEKGLAVPVTRLYEHLRSTDIGDVIQTASGECYLVDSHDLSRLPAQPIYAHIGQNQNGREIFPTLGQYNWQDYPVIKTIQWTSTPYYLEIRSNGEQNYRLLRMGKATNCF